MIIGNNWFLLRLALKVTSSYPGGLPAILRFANTYISEKSVGSYPLFSFRRAMSESEAAGIRHNELQPGENFVLLRLFTRIPQY